MSEITEADFIEGRDNWRAAYAHDATTRDCPDCDGRGSVMGADHILLCSQCDATGEVPMTSHDFHPIHEGCTKCAALPSEGIECEPPETGEKR
jgi:hypothetical protein